jgi:hypothetical protein
MVVKPAALGLAIALLLASVAWAADDDPGYSWIAISDFSGASLIYGAPDTAEDYVFALSCHGKRPADMTVYVDIAGTKVGAPVAIEFSFGAAKLSVPGKISTDEMSGFLFAEAKGFDIKPVIGVLNGKGAVSVKTGAVVTDLPEKGRARAVAKFAKFCSLD